jgi:NAD-dependent deacetylase
MVTEQIEAAVSLLRRANFAIALTGAGISTHSGIPDFRSPECGLWETSNPAEVASIYGFRHRPQDFYDWIRPLAYTILDAQPNAAHTALAHMEASGQLQCIITQNIDMLHTRAGSQSVCEIHGHLREATCINCFHVYSVREYILHFLESNTMPRCPDCGHALKPNVVLFGEQLPAQELIAAQRATRRCDVMLIAGSSLEVYPAAQFPLIAKQQGAALILVNRVETPVDPIADIVIHADVVDVLPHIAAALKHEQE